MMAGRAILLGMPRRQGRRTLQVAALNADSATQRSVLTLVHAEGYHQRVRFTCEYYATLHTV